MSLGKGGLMNGNTVFMDENTVSTLDSAPIAIYNTIGNVWKVELDTDEVLFVEAPDVIGVKVYNIVVDDVILMYDGNNNKLVWSITWSVP